MKLYQKYFSFFAIVLFTLASCTDPQTETYERFFFRNNGADLAVQVDGNRASNTFILLLHGGPGGNGYEYNVGTYSEKLEEQYAMVYLDQRGQGASQGNYSPEDVTLQQFSDDIYNLVLFLKQKYGQDISVFLMGHSWGGTTGTHALLNTVVQEEIKGWIEVDGAHDIPLLNKEAIEMFRTIGAAEIAAGNEVEEWTPIVEFAEDIDINNITTEDGGQINGYGFTAEGLIEAVNESTGGSYEQSLWKAPPASLASVVGSQVTASAILEETEAVAMTDNLNQITIPSLFLWGVYDFVVPPALGESAFERVNTTEKELVLFEHSGHSPMDTEPQLFVEEVLEFVAAYR